MRIGNLRNFRFLNPFFLARDWVMSKTGLFKVKREIKRFLFLKQLVWEDAKKKRRIAKQIMCLPDGLLSSSLSDTDFVISLTSYGKRVEDSLPYALFSLVTQTERPHIIVVYLDENNWSNEVLPPLLKKLQRVGVVFSYCEDIRSFKKLIPALKQFPNNPIITVDDDFYYHPEYLAWMTEAYKLSDKKTILGQWGCIPEKKNGQYIPYNEWKDCKHGDENSPISFYGCGCCYPPHIFDDEILKQDVFMNLCPKADDLWFWVMEERLSIERKYIPQKGYGYHRSVDRVFDYNVGADGCLTLSNVIKGENNVQLHNLLEYYNLE